MLRDRQKGSEHLERGYGMIVVSCLLQPQEDPIPLSPYKTKQEPSLEKELILKRTASFWRDLEKEQGLLSSQWSLIVSNIRRV